MYTMYEKMTDISLFIALAAQPLKSYKWYTTAELYSVRSMLQAVIQATMTHQLDKESCHSAQQQETLREFGIETKYKASRCFQDAIFDLERVSCNLQYSKTLQNLPKFMKDRAVLDPDQRFKSSLIDLANALQNYINLCNAKNEFYV